MDKGMKGRGSPSIGEHEEEMSSSIAKDCSHSDDPPESKDLVNVSSSPSAPPGSPTWNSPIPSSAIAASSSDQHEPMATVRPHVFYRFSGQTAISSRPVQEPGDQRRDANDEWNDNDSPPDSFDVIDPEMPSRGLRSLSLDRLNLPSTSSAASIEDPSSASFTATLGSVVSQLTPLEQDSDNHLPVMALDRLIEQLHRPRWVVPVLPNQELELVMNIAIKLISSGQDTDENFERFLSKGLEVSFDKLMNDEAMKDWKPEIHRFIWRAIIRFLIMFTEKMKLIMQSDNSNSNDDSFPSTYWRVLGYVFNARNRFYTHNMHRSKEALDAEPAEMPSFTITPLNECHAWLRSVLNRFGSYGGFELIKAYFDRKIAEENITVKEYIEWFRPFALCAQFLSAETVQNYLVDTVKLGAEMLLNVDDKLLKCETVKGELRDNEYLDLASLCRRLLHGLPELHSDVQHFRLRYILRVLKVAPFAGRMAALEEIHYILTSSANTSGLVVQTYSTEAMNFQLLTKWLRDHELIDILFRDNLHHPAFVERLEKVLRVLLRHSALLPEELDLLWKAQTGKHDVIQRNLHDLIARLAQDFSNDQVEQLFDRFKESWLVASARERALLLDLISRLGVDFNDNTEKALTAKALTLIWDLVRDEKLPLETMELALNAHFQILDALRHDELRMEYIKKCIEELNIDSLFVVPLLRHMQRLLMLPSKFFAGLGISKYSAATAASKSFTRNELIANVQQENVLCATCATNLEQYMAKIEHPEESLDAQQLSIDGRISHAEQLRARLDFIQFLLREGRLWLMIEQANQLWDSLVVYSVFETDRKIGFQLFASMMQNEDVDPNTLDQFFDARILKLDPRQLNLTGLECFDIFWKSANVRDNRRLINLADSTNFYLNSLELKGQNYLWEIIWNAPEEVSARAIVLWCDVYSSPAPEFSQNIQQLNERIINFCFDLLKRNYAQLTEESRLTEETKSHLYTQMARTLQALCQYIKSYDEQLPVVERQRVPLFRASVCRCYRVRVLFAAEQLQSARRHMEQRSAVDSVGKDGYQHSSIPVDVMNDWCEHLAQGHDFVVHSHMPLGTLKQAISKKMQGGARLPAHLQLPRFELFITTSTAASFVSTLIGGQQQRPLDAQDAKRTLEELQITPATCLGVRFNSNDMHIGQWNNRIPSPESSPESTPRDRSPTSEQANTTELEAVLPGVAVVAHHEFVHFLFRLADLGIVAQRVDLVERARHLLRLCPADLSTIEQLTTAMTGGGNKFESLFIVDHPSRSLYLLEMTNALLMPANCQLSGGPSPFQYHFFQSGGLDACLELLVKPGLLTNAADATRKFASSWLLQLLKVALYVTGRMAVNATAMHHSMVTISRDAIIAEVPGRNEQLFREICDALAMRLSPTREASSSKITAKHLTAMLGLAWACGSGCPEAIGSTEATISAAYEKPAQHQLCEQMAETALNSLALALAICPQAAGFLMEHAHWPQFTVDILFSNMSNVRNQAAEILYVIVTKMANDEKAVLGKTVDLLFAHVDRTEDWPELAGNYFYLLCRLLEYSNKAEIKVARISEHFLKELEWLDMAKRYTQQHMESYPKDVLLTGHLDVCRNLLHFLNPEQKFRFGSDPNNGRQFVKQLLEEFVLPSSRMFVEQRLAMDQITETMQRSATISTNLTTRLAPPIDHQTPTSMPRSATIGLMPTRCVPVCGTSESVSAAYDALVQFCANSLPNYRLAVHTLERMFYSEPLPVHPEWEFAPGVALRGPSSYVGLKNGGASCYMNSIFQQLFMIEPLRSAVLNAKCSEEAENSDSEEIDNNRGDTSSSNNYHLSILQCVQSIFAHLIGSEQQSFVPRQFWAKFRLANQIVNIREQQDALEFYNAVLDSIDEGLKSLSGSPICEQVFGGTFADQKICKGCPHRYQREEPFTSISVDIRSHNNLIDSLKEYVKGDLLDNDNAYLCELCNRKVAAIKRLCIQKLPPFLTIQLKRFDFDWEREIPKKFNDYFEFPQLLDMEPFTAQGLAVVEGSTVEGIVEAVGTTSETANDPTLSEGSLFRLRGVVVHSGQANGGHYYSFIRTDADGGRWFKFDDTDVAEQDFSSEEEMRSAWFGGDYTTDQFDNGCNRYQKRRQKRWWNAYLLIYERIASKDTKNQGTTSISTVSSTSLNNRLRQMPARLEALICSKNTRFVHERSQYTPEYFRLIRDLVALFRLRLTSTSHLYPHDVHRLAGDKEFALLTMRLLTRFLFTTGLHAKKHLRCSMAEWSASLTNVLQYSSECRLWFVEHILFEHNRVIVLYLLEASSTEVRMFFARILVPLLDRCRDDSASQITVIRRQFIRDGESVSDLLIRTLITVAQNNVTEFTRHPAQYFYVFHQYAQLGQAQRRQLIELGALLTFLLLVAKDEQLIRSIYQESAKLYQILALLLRSCETLTIATMENEENEAKSNPYAMPGTLLPMSPEVQAVVYQVAFIEKFFKMLTDISADFEVASEVILFLCWDNLPISQLAFQSITFETLFTSNELKCALTILRNLISLSDRHHDERVRYAIQGDGERYRGLLYLLVSRRDSFPVWKTYLILKSLISVIMEYEVARKCIETNAQLKEYFIKMESWLDNQLRQQSYYHTKYTNRTPGGDQQQQQPRTFGNERSTSAEALFEECERLSALWHIAPVDGAEHRNKDQKQQHSSHVVHRPQSPLFWQNPPSTQHHLPAENSNQEEDDGIGSEEGENNSADDSLVRNSVSAADRQHALADQPPPPDYETSVADGNTVNPPSGAAWLFPVPTHHSEDGSVPPISAPLDSTGSAPEDSPPGYEATVMKDRF